MPSTSCLVHKVRLCQSASHYHFILTVPISLLHLGSAFAPMESRARGLSALQSTVQSVHAREILDSRGNPTVEVRSANRLHFIGFRRIFNFLIRHIGAFAFNTSTLGRCQD